jgi:predicted O-methyltransferase YrrM
MWQILSFFRFLKKSKGVHRIHSPFVFQLYTQVILKERAFIVPENIENIRKILRANTSGMQSSPVGAGSRKLKKATVAISSVARISGSPEKYSRLLYRLAAYLKPATILEAGTSLGLGTANLAGGSPNAGVLSLEANPDAIRIAVENFRIAGLKNIIVLEGLFVETLPEALARLKRVDLVFLDGDHRKEPTVRYVKQILPFMHNDSLLIMDDIHWSKEMEDAWETVKNLPEVTVTIDLFRMGLVFFRKEQTPEHFILRY